MNERSPGERNELERLLALAEDIEGQVDRATTRLYVLSAGAIAYMAFSIYYILRFVELRSLGNANPLNYLFLLFPLAASLAAIPLVVRFQRRRRGDLRALDEVLELLREVESAISKEEGWSTLERAEFRIRLSRFHVRSRYG